MERKQRGSGGIPRSNTAADADIQQHRADSVNFTLQSVIFYDIMDGDNSRLCRAWRNRHSYSHNRHGARLKTDAPDFTLCYFFTYEVIKWQMMENIIG